MAEVLKGNCPYCGNELEIPAHLQEFSCLYCGKRSHIDLLRSRQDFNRADLTELASQLPQTLKEYTELYKHINKKDYAKYFAAYEAQHDRLLKRLDLVVTSAPEGVEKASAQVVEVFLETLDRELHADKRYGSKMGNSTLLFEIKLVLALFLTPLVRKLHLAMAEPFREELQKQWLARYPKENWKAGDYEEIIGGFRKRRLCYLTTAVCSAEGKADDCAELTALRGFRDGWLKENGGQELIDRYYELAPTLVTIMDHCENSGEVYARLRTQWIDPCLDLLSRGENRACKEKYVSMVEYLQKRYRV